MRAPRATPDRCGCRLRRRFPALPPWLKLYRGTVLDPTATVAGRSPQRSDAGCPVDRPAVARFSSEAPSELCDHFQMGRRAEWTRQQDIIESELLESPQTL